LKVQNTACIEWFPLAINVFTGLVSEVIISYHKGRKNLDPFWRTFLVVGIYDLRCWSPQERVSTSAHCACSLISLANGVCLPQLLLRLMIQYHPVFRLFI